MSDHEPRSFDDRFLDRVERMGERREEPRRASATPARAIPQKWLNREQSWQALVRQYDRNGPGFLGYVFDIKAQVASMVPLHVEQMDRQGHWSRTADASAQQALAAFIGVGSDQDSLIFNQFRSLESVGEYWLAAIDTPDGLRWMTLQTPQLDFKANGEVLVRTRPDESPNDVTTLRLRKEQIVRCHHPDPEWSGEAYSSVRRALPDIERYRSTVRNIGRTLDSRLLTNGLIWFAPDDPEHIQRPEPDTPIQSVEQVMADYTDIAWKALNDDSDFASFAPFPVSGAAKPEYVDVGRSLDPEVLAAETKALEAVGRALDFPQQLLVEGPGAGNHWSDLLLKDDFLTASIAPGLSEVCGYVTTIAVRPLLQVLRDRGANLEDPLRYRVWYDLTDVAKRPDTSDQMLGAWRDGIAGYRTTGQALGLSDEELLPLPDGVSEYEHWREAHSRTAGLAPSSPAPEADTPAAAPDPAESPNMTTTAAAGPDHHSGVMIALLPDRPTEFSAAHGLAPSDMHITLGYFGDSGALTPEQHDGLVAAVQETARTFRPLDVRVGGAALIGDDEPQATALLVESPDLQEMRDAIMAGAAAAGVPDGSNHPGFIGHMTIGYGLDVPTGVAGRVFRASTLRLSFGDEITDVPLGDRTAAAGLLPMIRLSPEELTEPRTAAPTSAVNIGPALSKIDRRLYDRLARASEIATAAAIANAGRAVMRALPQGPLRSSLRDVPLSDVWFSVPQEVRDEVGLTEADVLGPDPFGTLHEEVTAAFERADEETATELGKAGVAPGPNSHAADAAAFLLAGLGVFAASRLNNPNPPAPTVGEYDRFRTVPPSILRDTLRVSAGAAYSGAAPGTVTSKDSTALITHPSRSALVTDATGKPQTTEGTWMGGDGPATGPLTLSYLDGLGVIASPVIYEWVWGDAARPFDPHLNLNGTRFDDADRATVLANPDSFPDSDVYYPGDHDGCSCWEEIIIELTISGPAAEEAA